MTVKTKASATKKPAAGSYSGELTPDMLAPDADRRAHLRQVDRMVALGWPREKALKVYGPKN